MHSIFLPCSGYLFSIEASLFRRKLLKMKALKIFLSATLFLIANCAWAMPAQILLIRHAEKPTQGDEGSELSEQGWQRARLLPTLFQNRPELAKLGRPAALFAMAPQNEGGSIRAIQTLKFVAETFNLPINSETKRDDFHQMILAIQKDSKLDGQFVVICWERKVLTDIAADLGVKNPPHLGSDQFDRAWLLSFSQTGAVLNLQDFSQGLLPGDSASVESF